MSDSPASARAVEALRQDQSALHQDHRALSYQVTNLQTSLQNYVYDQQFPNETIESLVERCNILSTEVRLLQQALAARVQAAQIERDSLHLRVRILEHRESAVESHLDLNALD